MWKQCWTDVHEAEGNMLAGIRLYVDDDGKQVLGLDGMKNLLDQAAIGCRVRPGVGARPPPPPGPCEPNPCKNGGWCRLPWCSWSRASSRPAWPSAGRGCVCYGPRGPHGAGRTKGCP